MLKALCELPVGFYAGNISVFAHTFRVQASLGACVQKGGHT